MSTRFPALGRRSFGVGLDLPWGDPIGFVRDPGDGDRVTDRIRRFFANHGHRFSHVFLAFQPKDRNLLDATRYFPAYDSYFGAEGAPALRGLHQTMLNMGSIDPYPRERIANFCNAVVERYGIRWIVEDVGIWSMRGKVMPYPLPPVLTERGLACCIANVASWQAQLAAPLVLEFPGFTEGTNVFVGDMDAFEFFASLVEQTGAAATIDIGHVLSYQWLRGRTGARMLEGVERLPLRSCFEFHLSGCSISGGKFRDLHHGVLLDEQITLLEYLLPRCPRLQAITYEDPKFDADGQMIAKAKPNFARLATIAADWMAQ